MARESSGDYVAEATTQRRRLNAPRPQQAASLRCVWSPDPSAIGLELSLDGTAHEVGRERAAIRDLKMSRRHFQLEPSADGYWVRDLATANGTWMDGERIVGTVRLTGQVLSAGATLFVVDAMPEGDALPVAASATEAQGTGLVGRSSATSALRRAIGTVAGMDGAVLILGPTGAGKELTARALHDLGGRSGAFVPVNCAAISPHLAESELFGHVRGAFTGADRDQPGLFERASGGTIFLDEVGDLPPPLQAKLLRVLEDSVVRRVGAREWKRVDLRVVAATHVDLEVSGFRSDLFARLGDWIIRIPPLSARRADILELWEAFFGGPDQAPEMTAELREALLLYDWPMNVRELAKTARRVRELVGPGEVVDVDRLPLSIARPLYARQAPITAVTARASAPDPSGPPPAVDDANTPGRDAIVAALRAAKGNIRKAALANGWHRTQLYRWMERLEIDKKQFRS